MGKGFEKSGQNTVNHGFRLILYMELGDKKAAGIQTVSGVDKMFNRIERRAARTPVHVGIVNNEIVTVPCKMQKIFGVHMMHGYLFMQMLSQVDMIEIPLGGIRYLPGYLHAMNGSQAMVGKAPGGLPTAEPDRQHVLGLMI
jgi:hypothetical protein